LSEQHLRYLKVFELNKKSSVFIGWLSRKLIALELSYSHIMENHNFDLHFCSNIFIIWKINALEYLVVNQNKNCRKFSFTWCRAFFCSYTRISV